MMTSVFYQKTGGKGGGIKLTDQSPLLDLAKVYALGTTFLQICIYKTCHCMLGLRPCQLELQ